ncbi:MAG: glycosyltransferase [Blastocatellia bacterium]|nr:glycosyltransferase [Blastocatellia bacterium]
METTRMAYLVSQYPAISHTFILREVLQLRAQGFEIAVASINKPDRLPEKLTQDETNEAARTYYVKAAGLGGALWAHFKTLLTHPLGYVRGWWFALRLGGTDLKACLYNFFYFVEAVMVGVWMQQRALRHLHVHFATPASTVGMIAARIFPISYSITVHGPDEFYDVTLYRLREKIQAASFICCIGTYSRSQLMKLSPPSQWDKFEVSPLGVNPDLFAPQAFREVPQLFEIICVGRLVAAKGQYTLVSVCETLLRQGHQVRLRLVGDGPDRAGLEAMVQARGLENTIVFEGAVNQDRIRELYANADLFALGSFAEGIPVVLMEAMAMEIPCVTTHITGHHELIRDGVDGVLVSPSDVAGFAAAIVRLMQDTALRRRIATAGRVRVMEKYNLEANTRRLAEIFRRRLGKGT